MHTEKIYHFDTYTKSFEAKVLELREYNDRFAVLLDRTAFYPESGGQPSDSGTINGEEIYDVIELNNEILHIVAVPPSTDVVSCTIDWNRRFDHMQQHTGQHIISACFYKLFNGNTSSFHISSDYSTIEIDIPSFDNEMARELEDMTNQIVFDNTSVSSSFVAPEDLSKLPLRKLPKVSSNIRIVVVDGVDYSPCGGTHVRQTGEIGLIKLKRWEKLKSSYKFDFVCGMRALADYRAKNNTINELGSAMSVRDFEVYNSFKKLSEDFANTKKLYSQYRNSLLELEAEKLATGAVSTGNINIVAQVLEGKDLNDLKLIAQHITKNPSYVVVLAVVNNSVQIVLSCSDNVNVDMGKTLKGTISVIEGKGGGSPKLAQGGGSKLEALDSFMDKAVELIIEQVNT